MSIEIVAVDISCPVFFVSEVPSIFIKFDPVFFIDYWMIDFNRNRFFSIRHYNFPSGAICVRGDMPSLDHIPNR